MKLAVIALFATLFPIQHALAWGQEGHSIVAEIAEHRLESSTLEKVRGLLRAEVPAVNGRADVSLASIASWADDYRAAHRETTNWHFVNIPFDRLTYDPSTDCSADPQGDCIVNALERSRADLADCAKAPDVRETALKLVVHFVGDVHQPLHAAQRNGDHGGNDVMVTFFGQPTKLHALWDTGLIMHTVFAWGSYVSRLEANWFPGRDLAGLDGGSPADWAMESHRYARSVVYAIPDGAVLEAGYYDKALPVIDRQLALAGVRLARYLTDALKPTAACP